MVELNGPDVVRTVLAIHGWVGTQLRYQPDSTDIGQPIEEILAGGTGVCQDYRPPRGGDVPVGGIPARVRVGLSVQP